MAKKKTKEPLKGKYGDAENALASIVVDSEYETAKTNNKEDYATYEAILDMIEGIRSEKNYDWKSDINIPLVISHLLTDEAAWTSYFTTRDFVEVYLEGETGDKPKTMATKKLINKTLNMKDIYHFHKFIRTRIINWLYGNAAAICFWEQDIRTTEVPQPPAQIPYLAYENGQAVRKTIEQPRPPRIVETIITDRFNYEPLDPRNLFCSPEYCYSIQQKRYAIVRSEKTWEELNADKDRNGYINLDIVKARLSDEETETAKAGYNQLGNKPKAGKTPLKPFDVLDRYGQIPAIVEERDEDGTTVKASPGYDSSGQVIDDAEMIEGIVSFALPRGTKVLIRFQPTPFIDALGRSYKPLLRSWCYIHPSKDSGLSDGKNLRELQVGINDTFNVSNDAVMMETMPTLVGKKSSMEDNPTIYYEPEHLIELENPETDLQQLKFRANIRGAWTQIDSLLTFASQTSAVFPGTMGGLSGESGTTATEFSGTETQSNKRFNLKSLTFEYTWCVELYWLINQMTYRFARPETLLNLVGSLDLADAFDPNADYTYVPLSQSLESEHNKIRKAGVYDQMAGRLAGLAKIFPKEIGQIIAAIVGKQMVLMGAEYQDIADLVTALSRAKPQVEGEGATQTSDAGTAIPPSNQAGIEMSGGEMDARGLQ